MIVSNKNVFAQQNTWAEQPNGYQKSYWVTMWVNGAPPFEAEVGREMKSGQDKIRLDVRYAAGGSVNSVDGWVSFNLNEVGSVTNNWTSWQSKEFAQNGQICTSEGILIPSSWLAGKKYQMKIKVNAVCYNLLGQTVNHNNVVITVTVKVMRPATKFYSDNSGNSLMLWKGGDYIDRPVIFVEGFDPRNRKF
ncbi:MAG: hypothetical protein IT232_06385 [Flavobacteriales bacterium]|nr:hypothetical protein [Flavobacteriales bacterium]